jgi:hypothetical protein
MHKLRKDIDTVKLILIVADYRAMGQFVGVT